MSIKTLVNYGVAFIGIFLLGLITLTVLVGPLIVIGLIWGVSGVSVVLWALFVIFTIFLVEALMVATGIVGNG